MDFFCAIFFIALPLSRYGLWQYFKLVCSTYVCRDVKGAGSIIAYVVSALFFFFFFLSVTNEYIISNCKNVDFRRQYVGM